MRKGQSRIIRLPDLDPHNPVQDQLTAHLRRLILTGAIAPGARMPAQRALARELKLSRNTVIHAYESLAAEGLLQGRQGAGTYVSRRPSAASSPPMKLNKSAEASNCLPLQQGVPDLSLFPIRDWIRVQNRRWRALPASALGYGGASGWEGLRFILAQRVAAIRGVVCTPDQVHIVPSVTAAIRLAATALGIAGKKVLVESPGYRPVHAALTSAGAELVPIPVDQDGANIDSGLQAASDAALAYLTPTAQFPTGAPLSRAGRQSILRWARQNDGWILEDDYESDFVFSGKPPSPLAAERDAGRVIYMASLNNVIFPSTRLAFLVAPPVLLDRFTEARATMDAASDIPRQMVIHDFLEGGYLAAHLRRCREVYSQRREALRRALKEQLGDDVTLAEQPVGLHVMAWLRPGLDDALLSARAAEKNLIIHGLSACNLPGAPPPTRSGIYMGFAAFDPSVIEHAVARLTPLLRGMRSR